MKKSLILMIGMVMVSVFSFAQHDIKYDFPTKQFTILDTNMCKDTVKVKVGRLVLKYNKTYRFIITNVDKRYYHDFSITSEQRDFFEGELEGSYPILRSNQEEKTNLPPPSFAEQNKTLKTQKITQESQDKYKESIAALSNKRDAVVTSYNEIEKVKQYYNSLAEIFNSYMRRDISYQVMLSKIAEVDEGNKLLIEKKNSLDKEFNDAYKTFAKADSIFTKDPDVKVIEETWTALKSDHDLITGEANKCYSSFILFNKNNGYKRLLSRIESLLYRMKNIFITDICFPELIQPKKDELTINLEFQERLISPDTVKIVPRKCSYTFEVGGGIKITASTGLILTWGLYDRQYSVSTYYQSIQGNLKDSSYSMITEDSVHSKLLPTVGAFMHILYRASGSVTGGLTWGLGTNVSSQMNVQIFMGASLVLGREERFIITGGFATGPVNYLKGKYSVGKEYYTSDIEVGNLTEKVFKPGLFVGLSYNLTSQKKQKAGSSDD